VRSQPLGFGQLTLRRCPGSCFRTAAPMSWIVSSQTAWVGTRRLTEKEHLLALAAEPFDLAEISHPRIDQTGCAKVRTNAYTR
jgi:hypothetical protein